MKRPLRLLIVEDSADDSALLVASLKKAGFDLSPKTVDASRAFSEALEQGEWDLVISDNSMPGFSATRALELIKKRNLDVPLIIVSGTIEPRAAVAAMREGASDFVMKDDLTRLVPAIERELRESENRKARRKAEEERANFEAQLLHSQKMEAMGKLAGGVAHDFNNLLTAISGYCHFLLDAMPEGDPKRADVEEIERAGQRAATLTRQLLAFSRRQVLQPRVLDLNAAVSAMENLLRRIIGEDVVLETRLAADLGRIKADPGWIDQILMNLAVNGRDAMPGGGKLSVETSNQDLGEGYSQTHLEVEPGPHVMLAVGDTGVGMDAKTQAHVFEPFFTTKESGKGTGLGLATVYGIVRQLRGSVFVYSEPGRGTTFKIFFPRAEGPAEPARQEEKAAPPRGGTETILLVEDDETVRKFIHRILAKNGYTVLPAITPDEGLRVCREHGAPIELLITDLILPGMRGDELARRIEEARPGIRVIFTSGYTEYGAAQQGLETGRVHFLQKPLHPAGLARKVRAVLDGAPAA